MDTNCSTCGAPINFKTQFALTIACEFCGSNYVRKKETLDKIGEQSTVLDDITPYQIGTYGTYRDKHFEIIGRVRMGWEKGFWNEWMLMFAKKGFAWMAEAQGKIAFMFQDNNFSGKSFNIHNLRAGERLEFPSLKKSMIVQDIKKAKIVGIEGQLPIELHLNEEVDSVDFMDGVGNIASVQSDSNHRFTCFHGRYEKFSNIKFKNLRAIEGW